MRLEGNFIPILVIAAIILLLAFPAVGLIVGMALASEPTEESAPPSTPEATPPTPIPLQLPPLPDKKFQPADSPPQQATEESRSDWDGTSDRGSVYTYEDGDRTIRVVLQDDLAVQMNSALTSNDVVVVKGIGESIVRKQGGGGQDALPVFRSESGGGLMTLPGGVLLALDPKWDQAKIESFFSQNSISTEQISELEFIPNGFLVQTAAGFPSLELANSLAAQEGVAISSPNWWREVEAK